MSQGFVATGVQMQRYAVTRAEAEAKFNRSCTICTGKGNHMDCDRCPIAAVHKETMALLPQLPPQPKPEPGKPVVIVTTFGTVCGGTLVELNGTRVRLSNAKEYRRHAGKTYSRFVGDCFASVAKIKMPGGITITLRGE